MKFNYPFLAIIIYVVFAAIVTALWGIEFLRRLFNG